MRPSRPFVIAASMLILSALSAATSCFAVDISLYTKAGVMDWHEHGGRNNNSETGATQELGLRHSLPIDGAEFYQSVGLWLGELAYHGEQDISVDAGLKGSIGLYVPVKLTEGIRITTETGIDANGFMRYVPDQLWGVLSAKTGLGLRYGNVAEFKAGALYPIYTSVTNNTGRHLVTVHPRGIVTPYAEVTMGVGDKWTAGIYFESWRWSESPSSRGTSQPDTTVTNAGLNFKYSF